MGNFDELGRQLGYTFTRLENAEGRAKRRWLRKAHLLLLLADEMAGEEEAGAAGDDAFFRNPWWQQDDPETRCALRSTAAEGARPAKRASCQGLQTVLILRKRTDCSKNAVSEKADLFRGGH